MKHLFITETLYNENPVIKMHIGVGQEHQRDMPQLEMYFSLFFHLPWSPNCVLKTIKNIYYNVVKNLLIKLRQLNTK